MSRDDSLHPERPMVELHRERLVADAKRARLAYEAATAALARHDERMWSDVKAERDAEHVHAAMCVTVCRGACGRSTIPHVHDGALLRQTRFS